MKKTKEIAAIICTVSFFFAMHAIADQNILSILLRSSESDSYSQHTCNISAPEAIENRNDLAKKILSTGRKKDAWEILDLYENEISKYVGEYVSVWHFDDTSVSPYPLRFVYNSFNDNYITVVQFTFDINNLTKSNIVISSYDQNGSMKVTAEANPDLSEFEIETILFTISEKSGFDSKESAQNACQTILSTALDEFDYFLSDTTGLHLADLGIGSELEDSIITENVCAVDGCKKEGTISIVGLSGETEYYCQEHYDEMEEILDQLLSDYQVSDDGYEYDSNDPYYSANDHNHDGKISDQEFQDAMGALLDDLAAANN